jgi:membrane-bound ClpP family serine protease
MPFAIAVVSPPAGAYAWLVVAIGVLTYALYVPRFVSAFAGTGAGVLAALGYLSVPADPVGFVLLALGALLLYVEFLRPTFGAAAIAGLAAAVAGSWRLLGAAPPIAPLPPTLRIACAIAGALALLVVTERAVRRYTLPPEP